MGVRFCIDPSRSAFRPASGGRFRIEADSDGVGEVRPTDDPADITLGAKELGVIALGSVAPSALARVGRVTEQ